MFLNNSEFLKKYVDLPQVPAWHTSCYPNTRCVITKELFGAPESPVNNWKVIVLALRLEEKELDFQFYQYRAISINSFLERKRISGNSKLGNLWEYAPRHHNYVLELVGIDAADDFIETWTAQDGYCRPASYNQSLASIPSSIQVFGSFL